MIVNSGEAPELETELLKETIRQLLLGLEDAVYAGLDAEVDLILKTKSKLKEALAELDLGTNDTDDAFGGTGSEEQRAGTDPTGESGTTAVANTIPAVS